MNPSVPDDEVRWLVAGRVQGVGYRWFVLRAATRLGIHGDVRNLRDGRVEVRARGESGKLEALLEELRRGPSGSRVEGVERLAIGEATAFDGFDIRD